LFWTEIYVCKDKSIKDEQNWEGMGAICKLKKLFVLSAQLNLVGYGKFLSAEVFCRYGGVLELK
jgi:hypothetical protein